MQCSIIIPTYNMAKFIRQCLESIVSQQRNDFILGKDYEIIVVNDGSIDDTLDIVGQFFAELATKQVVNENLKFLINHDTNLGPAKSVNDGLDIAQGDYITWIGADDLMTEDSLKLRIEELQKGDCDVVYTDFTQIDENGNKINDVSIRPLPSNPAMIRQLMVGNFINGSTVMMKKTNLRYDDTLKADPDCDMWIRLLSLNAKFKHISDKTVQYRIHSGQVSQNRQLMADSKDFVRARHIIQLPERVVMSDVISSWSDAYRELGNQLFNQGLYNSAISAMQKSMIADNAKPAPMPKEPHDKPRLAIISSGGNAFLSFVPKLEEFDIRFNRQNTLPEINALCQWADIAWFEWVDQMLLTATKIDKHCKYITRLHSYEAFDNVIRMVDWSKVDDIVFVAKHIQDICNSQSYELSKVNQHVIPNGVDLSKRTFREHGHGYNLAYIGYINHKKNPSLLLQCMKELVMLDKQYKLHIAGIHQELRYQLYWNKMVKELGLMDNIIMYGWIQPEDIDVWLQDKDYVVSTSELESFCYGIADGMACGIKPICHNWYGAENIYPKWALFNDIKEFLDGVDDRIMQYNSQQYREYIQEHYDLYKVSEDIRRLLLSKVG